MTALARTLRCLTLAQASKSSGLVSSIHNQSSPLACYFIRLVPYHSSSLFPLYPCKQIKSRHQQTKNLPSSISIYFERNIRIRKRQVLNKKKKSADVVAFCITKHRHSTIYNVLSLIHTFRQQRNLTTSWT